MQYVSEKKAPRHLIIMFWQVMTIDIHEDGNIREGINERVINECRSEGEGT